MLVMVSTKSALIMTGKLVNDFVSFVIFSVLDMVDLVLCYVYKIIDFFIEAEWKPCYCSSSKEAITGSGKILLSEQGESTKIVSLITSSKLQLEDISDTLYTRPSLVSEVTNSTVKRLKTNSTATTAVVKKSCDNTTNPRRKRNLRSTFSINSTIVEMIQGRIGVGSGSGGGRQKLCHVPRWSDCDCHTCNNSCNKDRLYVKTGGATGNVQEEDVLFIHGFISSSAFWTETLFPNFSGAAKSKYRFIAVDLLGFGKSPKPNDSFYTLREHLDMIEKSVLEPYKVKSFHIVAHSLGCILALALAVKHPGSVKSLTLLAPPYFPVPKGVQGSQYMMRKVAPRRVWPLIAFGASMACWYEHISRTICLLICKNHRLWDFLIKLLTRNRIRTYMIDVFCCHSHNAAWHTLHNIICGTAGKIETYLDVVGGRLKCGVTVFHGRDDELIPVECSFNVKSRIPRARVKVFENKDHITIVVGRQKDFARELEQIWNNNNNNNNISNPLN